MSFNEYKAIKFKDMNMFHTFCLLILATQQNLGNDDNNITTYSLVGTPCLVTGLLIAVGIAMLLRYRRKR